MIRRTSAFGPLLESTKLMFGTPAAPADWHLSQHKHVVVAVSSRLTTHDYRQTYATCNFRLEPLVRRNRVVSWSVATCRAAVMCLLLHIRTSHSQTALPRSQTLCTGRLRQPKAEDTLYVCIICLVSSVRDATLPAQPNEKAASPSCDSRF